MYKGTRINVQRRLLSNLYLFFIQRYARDLFVAASTEKIFIKVNDLSTFEFSSAREGGENVSNVRWVEAGHALTEDQVAEQGLDQFSVRACVQPESGFILLLLSRRDGSVYIGYKIH